MDSSISNASDIAAHTEDDCFFVGLASSYPDITDSTDRYFKLSWPQSLACQSSLSPSADSPTAATVPGCKVFHPQSKTDTMATTATAISPTSVKEIGMDYAVGEDAWLMREQVMVFRYKGKFHAVDHACPHRAYSLSWGKPFDIEDSGRVLGVGLRCRGHGYAFELSTGGGDRGSYKLGVWEVDLRPLTSVSVDSPVCIVGEGPPTVVSEDKEVWVKRKTQRT